MMGKVVNQSFVLLSKSVANRQESALKTATSHMRKPFGGKANKNTSTIFLWLNE